MKEKTNDGAESQSVAEDRREEKGSEYLRIPSRALRLCMIHFSVYFLFFRVFLAFHG